MRLFSPHRSFTHRRMCGGSRSVLPAGEAGSRKDESKIGGVSRYAKKRSGVQQLLVVPRAKCVHTGRGRNKPEGLVQVLGQKAWLSRADDLNAAARYPRGNRAARSLGSRSRSSTSSEILWHWHESGIDPHQPQRCCRKTSIHRKTAIVRIPT